eukprot:2094957-Rhodomonas_salina.1
MLDFGHGVAQAMVSANALHPGSRVVPNEDSGRVGKREGKFRFEAMSGPQYKITTARRPP